MMITTINHFKVIRIDKSPRLRIVIPTIQIVHSQFFVIVVSLETEWIPSAQSIRTVIRQIQQFSPRIILIFYKFRSVTVKNSQNIPKKKYISF